VEGAGPGKSTGGESSGTQRKRGHQELNTKKVKAHPSKQKHGGVCRRGLPCLTLNEELVGFPRSHYTFLDRNHWGGGEDGGASKQPASNPKRQGLLSWARGEIMALCNPR